MGFLTGCVKSYFAGTLMTYHYILVPFQLGATQPDSDQTYLSRTIVYLRFSYQKTIRLPVILVLHVKCLYGQTQHSRFYL